MTWNRKRKETTYVSIMYSMHEPVVLELSFSGLHTYCIIGERVIGKILACALNVSKPRHESYYVLQ